MSHEHISPDCVVAKHLACSGDAWCDWRDCEVDCRCQCHYHKGQRV